MNKKAKALLSKIRKVKKAVYGAAAAATSTAVSIPTVFAAPTGVNTTQTDQVVDIIVWIVIIAIAAAGAFPSIVKIAEGVSNEDTRGRNAGIGGLVITAACAGAVYAIKEIFF